MQHTRLSNGVSIVTQPVAGATTVAIAMHVRGGARAQREGEDGFAHLMEHLLMESTPANGAEGNAAFFARLGGAINAFTGREHLALVGHVPASKGCDLVARFTAMLTQVRIEDASIAQELDRQSSECMESASNLEDALETTLLQAVWPGHPLTHPILPESTGGKRIDVSALRGFWSRMLTGSSVSLLAAGALDHELIVISARELQSLPAGPAQFLGGPPRFSERVRCRFPSVRQDETRLLWALPSTDHGECAEVLAHLLCGTTHGRLYRLLRDQHAFVYGVRAFHLQYSDAGVLAFECSCATANEAPVLSAVENHMADLLRNAISPAEYALTRESLEAKGIVDAARIESNLEALIRSITHMESDPVPSLDGFVAWLRRAWPLHALLR